MFFNNVFFYHGVDGVLSTFSKVIRYQPLKYIYRFHTWSMCNVTWWVFNLPRPDKFSGKSFNIDYISLFLWSSKCLLIIIIGFVLSCNNSSCGALSPDRMDSQKSDSICHSTGTELSKCYSTSSYTLNLTVVLQGLILVCVGTMRSIRSHFFFCLCCATDTNSSICVRDDILNMVIYNLYFEVFFWWMLDCSVGFLDCCVGLIRKRLTLYVCSSLSNAVPSSCLFNLHILQHTSAICPF